MTMTTTTQPTAAVRGVDSSSGYLRGKRVVLTGAVPGDMTRQQAWARIEAVGGIPQKSVTRSTDILVVGSVRESSLRADASTTRKQDKADEYGVETMSGFEFLSVLHADAQTAGVA